jgi:hypothetical protein
MWGHTFNCILKLFDSVLENIVRLVGFSVWFCWIYCKLILVLEVLLVVITGVFFFLFFKNCEVGGLMIIQKRTQPNLVIGFIKLIFVFDFVVGNMVSWNLIYVSIYFWPFKAKRKIKTFWVVDDKPMVLTFLQFSSNRTPSLSLLSSLFGFSVSLARSRSFARCGGAQHSVRSMHKPMPVVHRTQAQIGSEGGMTELRK